MAYGIRDTEYGKWIRDNGFYSWRKLRKRPVHFQPSCRQSNFELDNWSDSFVESTLLIRDYIKEVAHHYRRTAQLYGRTTVQQHLQASSFQIRIISYDVSMICALLQRDAISMFNSQISAQRVNDVYRCDAFAAC
jgi:hypothetical protein